MKALANLGSVANYRSCGTSTPDGPGFSLLGGVPRILQSNIISSVSGNPPNRLIHITVGCLRSLAWRQSVT